MSLYFLEAVVEYCLAPIVSIRGGCMLKYFLVSVVCLFLGRVVFADTYVQGYQRRDGTYVQPHMRTSPDSNLYNN
jgi:hypothetical protein